MTKHLHLWLAAAALVTALLLVACGGDDGGDAATPTAGATADGDEGEPTVEPTAEGGDTDGAGAFEDIPVPDGADEQASGSFTSDQIPFVVPNPDFDASAFANIEYRQYSVEGTADELLDFYDGELADWEEVYKFSGAGADGAGAFGVWTRSDGAEALWAGFSEAGGTTQLVLIRGTSD